MDNRKLLTTLADAFEQAAKEAAPTTYGGVSIAAMMSQGAGTWPFNESARSAELAAESESSTLYAIANVYRRVAAALSEQREGS